MGTSFMLSWLYISYMISVHDRDMGTSFMLSWLYIGYMISVHDRGITTYKM